MTMESHATRVVPTLENSPGHATGGYTTALAVEIPLMIIALTTVILRVYSRFTIKRRLAADDLLIILGTAAAISRTVISCMSADHNWGYDRRGPDKSTEIPYYQHIFERRIAYLFAVTFIRFSILTYYLRIFPSSLRSLRRYTYALFIATLLLFLTVLTVLIIYCHDISKLWTHAWRTFSGSQCFSSSVYSYSAAIGDSVIDSMIFALPVPYVWQLSKLRVGQRCGLVLIFGMGCVVCVVALLQIPFIKRREGSMTYFGSTVNILVAIQISFAIVAASLPDLRALIARKVPKLSPLHHRSLGTAAVHCNGFCDEEMAHTSPVAFEGKKVFRKPDWLRSNIPASLMSTVVTRHEGGCLGRGDEEVAVPKRALG